jgi:ligand-binding sensor domain-containing protein
VFTQVKVPRNDGTNYADYLLSGTGITAICIDGGGRKWFGTENNGAYLISEDNLTQIQHFTTDNSKLLSNHITSIAINNTTGEVFFGTENGLCSYMSDATTASDEMSEDNVYAYPNPVEPNYTGLITIVGLSYDADVKILTSSGRLVAQGRSNGGTFTWNGCDLQGRRVASGIYMVATATSSGDKGVVCKIAVVN